MKKKTAEINFKVQRGADALWQLLTDAEADECEATALEFANNACRGADKETAAVIYHASFAGRAYGRIIDREEGKHPLLYSHEWKFIGPKERQS